MLLVHMRRQEAIRSLPVWVMGSVFPALLLSGLYVVSTLLWPAAAASLAVVAVGCLPAVYLVFGRIYRRGSALELALPLSARRLWLAHLSAVLLAAMVVAAVSLAIFGLVDLVRGEPGGPELGVAALALRLAAGLALAVAILERERPQLASLPAEGELTMRKAVTLVAVLGMVLVLRYLPLAWTLAPLAAALAVAVATCRSLPAAFTLVPRAPETARHPAAPRVDGRAATGVWAAAAASPRLQAGHGAGWKLFAAFWRAPMKKGPTPRVLLPFLLFLGWMLSGYQDARLGLPDIRLDYVFMSWFLLLAFVWKTMSTLRLFDALPVSRRRLFTFMTAPSLAAVALGYAAGRLLTPASAEGVADEGRILPFLLLGVALPWLVALALAQRTFRAGVSETARKVAMWGALAAVVSAYAAVTAAKVGNVIEAEAPMAFLKSLARQLTEVLPGGALAIWGLTVLLLAAGYRLAEAPFLRAEVLPARGGAS